MNTVMLNCFKDYLFEARIIIIIIIIVFSSLNYFYSFLHLHTKKVFPTLFPPIFSPIKFEQNLCTPSFAFPHWNFKIWHPSLSLWFRPLIYNIRVFFHPKCSTYIQLVWTNWPLTRWSTHKLFISCPLS